jgi:hypothetical protein
MLQKDHWEKVQILGPGFWDAKCGVQPDFVTLAKRRGTLKNGMLDKVPQAGQQEVLHDIM